MADQQLAQADAEPGAAGAPRQQANAAPEAAADCAVTAAGAPIRIPVLANDRDPDGDALVPEVTAPPEQGWVAVNPDGTITYTPAAGAPARDAFTYEAQDGAGGADDAPVYVLVNPAAEAAGAAAGQPEGGAALAGLDPEALPALAAACADATALDVVTLEGADVVVAPPEPGRTTRVEVEPGQEIALRGVEFADARYLVADGGLLVVLPDGRLVFLAGFVEAARGDAPPVLATAGRPAVAGDELLARLDAGELPGEVARGPEHGGGAGFRPYDPGAIGPGLDPLGPLGPTALAFGVPEIDPDPIAVLDADDGDDGDGGNGGNGGGPGGLRPVAEDDAGATDEDTPVRVDVLDNDAVVADDGAPPAGAAELDVVDFTQPGNGTVALNPDGTFDYTPRPDFTGTDRFTYTVEGPEGRTDTALVVVEVGPVNDPPVAEDDRFRTDEDTALALAPGELLANDRDVDGDPLTIVEVGEAANGEVVLGPDGTVTYTPAPDFNGIDRFTYTVADPEGATDTAEVIVDVGPVNDPPVITGTTERTAPVADIGATGEGFDYASAFPLPDLVEGRALADEAIHPVDPDNLALPEARNAEVTFLDEIAVLANMLGVYLIDREGFIVEPRVIFPNLENVAPGTTVPLTDLYTPAELAAGVEFQFFLVANGAALNPDIDFAEGELRFLLNGEPAQFTDDAPLNLVHEAPSGEVRSVEGDIFHTRDDSYETPFHNSQNPGGDIQALSGLEPGVAGLTIAFEDLRPDQSDRDFNDALFRVTVPPEGDRGLVGGPAALAQDLAITDPDDADLVRATVEITAGERPGDALVLAGFEVGPDGAVGDTGIRVVDGGDDGRLVLEGRAPIATYEAVLQSVAFDNPEPSLGAREIAFVVEDPNGAESNVFTVALDVQDAVPEGTPGDDELFGTADDDVLDAGAGDDLLAAGLGDDRLSGGEGDDLLFGSLGVDLVEGGPGADTHVYRSLDDRGDRIVGFDATEGDRLDVSDLLKGFDPGTSDINDFLKLNPTGDGDIVVSVDPDGAEEPLFGFAPIELATLVQPVGVGGAEDLVGDGARAAAAA